MQKIVIAIASLFAIAVAQTPAEAAGIGSKVYTAAPRIVAPGGRVMLNPQPLPPKVLSFSAPGSRVMLNPQPLPPKVFMGLRIR